MLQNIPYELQKLNQWVVASGVVGEDGKPNKEPLNPRTGFAASVTKPETWGSFEQAQQCNMRFVGFVLSKEDPYSIIDLDPPETTIQKDKHTKLAEAFQSYTEFSQSGKGLHIIVKGKIPKGVRRDKVEVYSAERYMICTGNVWRNLPIVDQQDLLDALFKEMDTSDSVPLVQTDGTLGDKEVFDMASSATNGHKFTELWNGTWQGNPIYPSQSEADFALIAMLAFYSKDNEQVRRLFRWSALGQRPKATRNNKYIDFALSKCRAKEPLPIDLGALVKQAETLILNGHDTERKENCDAALSNSGVQATEAGSSNEASTDDEGNSAERGVVERARIKLPAGFLGECAEYITSSSIRPVQEIGLASAVALTAGVCGRAYNISGIGLNQYLILLAKTGSGKEGVARGIDNMVSAVRKQIPNIDQFIGPGTFASGQALIRVLDAHPCFVSVLGEFGLTLQQLCDPRANASQLVLKRVLLDIYSKSGFQSTLRSSVYSDAEKNTKLVQAPNVTIIGESTPDTFFSGLDQSHIAEGLIPRFTIIEYTGARPARNPNANRTPDDSLTNRFAELAAVALQTEQSRTFLPVQIDRSASNLLDEFDAYADDEINKASADVTLQLWNRAHLKAVKLAGLVAVGCNAHAPTVTKDHAYWAIELATNDVRRIIAKFSQGAVGVGAERQEYDVRRAIQDYLKMPKRVRKTYEVAEQLLDAPIVPFSYIRRRLQVLSSFRSDRRGTGAAIESILDDLIKAEVLAVLPAIQAKTQFGCTSPLYVMGRHWEIK